MSWLRFVACGSLGTSVFSYKRKNLDIATLAQKLNAANILKGSVRTPGKGSWYPRKFSKTGKFPHGSKKEKLYRKRRNGKGRLSRLLAWGLGL